jgi:hypothetical protein
MQNEFTKISRKEAEGLGLKRYFTGNKCRKGHTAEHQVSDAKCLECKSLRDKEYYQKNIEKCSKYNKEYNQIQQNLKGNPPKGGFSIYKCPTCDMVAKKAHILTHEEMCHQVSRSLNFFKSFFPEVNYEKIKNRRAKLMFKYGISLDEFTSLFIKQFLCCAIYKEQFIDFDDIKTDHDHKSEKVRGLLCHPCNLMLGQCKDDTNILPEGALYIYDARIQ